MEGDHPSGARVLSEYRRLERSLQKMEEETHYQSLHKMIGVMLRKLAVYQKEALNCDTLVLATVLNPSKRMKFFEHYYPAEVSRVQQLLNQALDKAFQEAESLALDKHQSSMTSQPVGPTASQTSHGPTENLEDQDDENLFRPSEVSESTT